MFVFFLYLKELGELGKDVKMMKPKQIFFSFCLSKDKHATVDSSVRILFNTLFYIVEFSHLTTCGEILMLIKPSINCLFSGRQAFFRVKGSPFQSNAEASFHVT